jgi:hypothetical protein
MRKKKFSLCDFPFIFVTWLDVTANERDWKCVEDINGELIPITSVGFLIKQTDKTIIIASSVSKDRVGEDVKVADEMIIPRSLILNIRSASPTGVFRLSKGK